MVTVEELVEELNLVAEYAGVEATFTVAGPAQVGVWDTVYEVDLKWAMGNVKGLPDRCTVGQIRRALAASHPSITPKGVQISKEDS